MEGFFEQIALVAYIHDFDRPFNLEKEIRRGCAKRLIWACSGAKAKM